MSGMKVVLAGCTGFIGRALVKRLRAEGHELVFLVRSAKTCPEVFFDIGAVWEWSVGAQGWFDAIEGADAVVNLAGAPIMRRWTKRAKAEIWESRILTTRALVDAIETVRNKPSVLVNASAVGIYGKGFAAALCQKWEAEAARATRLGVRVVLPRISLVLGGESLVDAMMNRAFRLFVGGHFGSGTQGFPWIHIDDLCDIFISVLANESVLGPVDAAVPSCVSMKTFCQRFGKQIKRPSWLHVPAWAIRFVLGEASGLLLETPMVSGNPSVIGIPKFSYRNGKTLQ